MALSLKDILETAGSIFIQNEQIKAGVPLGSTGQGTSYSEYPHVNTGTNYDGSTLVQPGQFVAGVDNRTLLGGAALVVLLAAAGVALAMD